MNDGITIDLPLMTLIYKCLLKFKLKADNLGYIYHLHNKK